MNLESKNLVLNLFTSPTCSPCKLLKETLKNNNISYIEHDITLSNNRKKISSWKISSVPTIVVCKNDKPIQTIIGYSHISKIKNILQKI